MMGLTVEPFFMKAPTERSCLIDSLVAQLPQKNLAKDAEIHLYMHVWVQELSCPHSG